MEGSGRQKGGRASPEGAGTPSDEGEIRRVLHDIERLAGQLRKVRSATGERRGSENQIRALEASLRAKWEEVRTLRARRSLPGGPLSGSHPRLGRGPPER